MWRTAIQTRQPLETTWRDAFPTWYGTPTDPFWWSYYPVEEADQYVESLLGTLQGVEIREVADSDVEAPQGANEHWKWAALSIDQLLKFPMLDDEADNFYLNHFKAEFEKFAALCKRDGVQVRVVMYCARNCSEPVSMIDEEGNSVSAVFYWSSLPR